MTIYLLANVVNGKYYVGQTIASMRERLRTHAIDSRRRSGPLQCAIRKYGIGNFAVEVLATAVSFEQLNHLETLWIVLLASNQRGVGYNCDTGGDSQIPNEETRRKGGLAQRGRTLSVATRRKMSAARRGRTFSPESRAKISAANKGKTKGWIFPPERCDAMSAVQMGHVVSEETRAKISAGHRGKKLSDEHKAKLSAALKGRLPAIHLRRINAAKLMNGNK